MSKRTDFAVANNYGFAALHGYDEWLTHSELAMSKRLRDHVEGRVTLTGWVGFVVGTQVMWHGVA